MIRVHKKTAILHIFLYVYLFIFSIFLFLLLGYMHNTIINKNIYFFFFKEHIHIYRKKINEKDNIIYLMEGYIN